MRDEPGGAFLIDLWWDFVQAKWAQVMRVTMVMNQCAGVVALFVVALTAPFLLRM